MSLSLDEKQRYIRMYIIFINRCLIDGPAYTEGHTLIDIYPYVCQLHWLFDLNDRDPKKLSWHGIDMQTYETSFGIRNGRLVALSPAAEEFMALYHNALIEYELCH